MSLYSLFHPEIFQGRHKKTHYFEGWYFKMALPGRQPEVLSIIPGVALGASEEERHAFIQVISSREGKSWNIHFPFESFKADEKKLFVEIAGNHFSTEEIILNINHEDLILSGCVKNLETHSFPVTLASPGIMGWYAYVPFMECFHGVVSTSHTLWGSLTLNGNKIDMSEGIGYIEKDWGTSFPEAWIWMQSNCFPSTNISCMLSVAKIPFLGHVFPGFLGFVKHGDELIRFGTYTGAKITHLESNETQASVQIQTKEKQLTFLAELGPASKLVAPRQGKMERPLLESIIGTITLTIRDKDGALLLEETGTMAGIELSEAGNLKS
ncbi:tocopherol cyclase family protein [uncultured Sphaerochaeta sp.]|uniref:tocopherol cyclase family protein n=1 Tax=uncultured Sphaerochaeta sp. TaxID=886478 RepID=UPI002A0A7496|nr:tocopherol cyclase family protein [uncultured Sphaerochaeta sp.]